MAKIKDNVNTISLPYNFTPRWYQLELLKAFDSGIRFFCINWGRRLGKDLLCFNIMIREAFKTPGTYFYFLPTYEYARKVIWENDDGKGRKLLDYIPGWKEYSDTKSPNEYVKRINNQSMIIELTNGSVIRMIAADTAQNSVVGTNPLGAVFSEFALQDPQGLKYMSPVFANNGGWYIINSTPRGQNHFYDRFIAGQNSDKWFTSQINVEESLSYSPEQIAGMREEYLMAGMTEDEILQEMYCSFTAGVRGAYYSDLIERARSTGRIAEFPDNGSPVDTFWDLGIRDDTAIWFRQIQNGKIVFIDYYKASGEPMSHYVDVLLQKGYRYRTHYLPHDGNNSKDLGTRILTASDMLRELLTEVKIEDDVVVVPRVSLQAGIQAVRLRFPVYHFNSVNCKDAIKMLEQYSRKWDPSKGVFSQHPIHDYTSHAADALRVEGCAAELSVDQFTNNDDFIDEALGNSTKIDSTFDVFGD